MDSIILIGPRASGKTSVGKILAARSGLPFLDADAVFSKLYGSISDYQKEHGWEKFRSRETAMLEQICASNLHSRIILAAGGGAVAHNNGLAYRERNVQVLRNFGYVFYLLPYKNLGMSAVILQDRVENDAASASQRPPLTDIADPYEAMLSILEPRDYLYRKAAHHVIYTARKTSEQVADDICAVIMRETTPKLVRL